MVDLAFILAIPFKQQCEGGEVGQRFMLHNKNHHTTRTQRSKTSALQVGGRKEPRAFLESVPWQLQRDVLTACCVL